MADLALPSTPVDLASRRPAAPSVADVRTREQAEEVAKDFERMFLSEMLRPMFDGLETDAPFGGGSSEQMFRPMLIDEYAGAMTNRGGIGISEVVLKEILRMQGLE